MSDKQKRPKKHYTVHVLSCFYSQPSYVIQRKCFHSFSSLFFILQINNIRFCHFNEIKIEIWKIYGLLKSFIVFISSSRLRFFSCHFILTIFMYVCVRFQSVIIFVQSSIIPSILFGHCWAWPFFLVLLLVLLSKLFYILCTFSGINIDFYL